MKKIFRLASKEDFKCLYRYGLRFESSFIKLFIRDNTVRHPRFAFIVPKTVEKRAVARNKLRRRAKEWIRKRVLLRAEPVDVVLLFKKGVMEIPREKLYDELSGICGYIKKREE